ncbi:PREDICTED: calcium-binding tyrosine phosphorylation-regulated protein [Gekko japonicus]|uniref:Calcium-binding tyrosine phosphorylation-regulated protein n=1 Tax=Gekko japonicus TaxID=146911 RepID=A0ABM1KR93_GEKJA|nr:PREDICTED: calcium-binding tyrosine phosphorylation-regulated protein [Gekko japonicus]
MMHTGKPRMVVPYGLKTLLEGVSRAVLKTSPSNITEFAALYFRELIIFREEHPNLDIKDLVREFHLSRVEGWAEAAGTAAARGPSKRADIGDAYRPDLDGTAPMSEEPKRKEKSTDTEEDQISEEPARELSTKTTQYPSKHEDFVDKPGDEKARELAYVPADPAQLAAQMLGNETLAYEAELKDAAISVQTLPTLSHSAEDVAAAPAETPAAEEEPPAPEAAPVEAAPVEAAPVEVAPAASAHSIRAEPDTRSQTSVLGEVVPSGSQAELPPDDVVEEASSDPLQEEPPPPAPPPPPDKDPLQAESCPSEIEVTSDLQLTPFGVEDPDAGGEAPPYIEQFPQQIVIPFIDNVACLIEPLTASLNAGQFKCTSILDPSADDAECDHDRMDTTEQLRPTDPGFVMSVAIPLEDVMTGKKGSGAGDKAPFAGSYGIAGEITFTTASIRRTE